MGADVFQHRRRSLRVPAELRIAVSCAGETVPGRTGMLSRFGALILCSLNLHEGDELTVTNRASGDSVACRVVWCGDMIVTGERKYGVEMVEDRPSFWGMDFTGLAGDEAVG
jgi:hypothetical protein